MLSGIHLHNFKAFDKLDLELAPITLLLGPNNSGKSSIIAAVRLLVQTKVSSDPQLVLLLDGIMGDFGTYRDIVYGNHRGRPFEIGLSIISSAVKPGRKSTELEWLTGRRNVLRLDLEYKYRTRRKELILKGCEFSINEKSILITEFSKDSERQLIKRVGDHVVPARIKSSFSKTLRMMHFLPYTVYPRLRLRRESHASKAFYQRRRVGDLLETTAAAVRNFGNVLERVDYVGPMRMPPSRTYLYSGEKRWRIGPAGENAAGILAMDTVRGGARSLNIDKNVSEWLREAGIGSSLTITEISDRHFEIRVQHPKTREYQNLADVGQGNSQILPVLVGGYNLADGAIYMVEEPEIHLHPRAQAELGDFFLDLYNRGVQSIVETHSEYLILRLLQHIAHQSIPPDHIRIYYVYPMEDKKKVEPLTVDASGYFIEEWPEGFFPERLAEAKKLAKLRSK